MELILVPFLEATVRTATPLAFAAIGELVSERAGVMNLGLEGTIIIGCLAALLGAQAWGVGGGFAAALVAGVAFAALFAVFVVWIGTDQIITGTAFTILGLGLTGAVFRAMAGGSASAASVESLASAPTIGPIAIPGLASVPLAGSVLFTQPLPTYLLFALAPTLVWWMRNSSAGLALRAVGERPEAAAAVGVRVAAVRWGALLFSGAMGGLCGATLVLAQVGAFNEGMSAGRGFIAIAIVVLGRWSPLGVIGATLAFGAAFALQFLFQALAVDVPYPLILAVPYVLTLALLAALRGRHAAPASLGR